MYQFNKKQRDLRNGDSSRKDDGKREKLSAKLFFGFRGRFLGFRLFCRRFLCLGFFCYTSHCQSTSLICLYNFCYFISIYTFLIFNTIKLIFISRFVFSALVAG
jgi:hypothetical protein